MQLFLYEWVGIYVVAASPDAAWALLVERCVDPVPGPAVVGMTEAMRDRLGDRKSPIRDPRDYLHAVEPSEVVELPYHVIPSYVITVANMSPALQYESAQTVVVVGASAHAWAEALPGGWTWDAHS